MTHLPDPDLKARAGAAFERSRGDAVEPMREADSERIARLERGLLSLSRLTREIFLAHRIDGYSDAKIADITGLSRKGVMRHMAKAFVRLTRYMDGDERSPRRRWWQSQRARWFG